LLEIRKKAAEVWTGLRVRDAIDATKSLATLTSHGVKVSLEYWFTETGELSGIYKYG
jgi:hypothetical protein